jgi:ribosome-binding factor A
MVFFDSLSAEALAALEERRAQLQASVNAQTRLKRTPKLAFMADPAIAHGAAVEEIIRRQNHDDA